MSRLYNLPEGLKISAAEKWRQCQECSAVNAVWGELSEAVAQEAGMIFAFSDFIVAGCVRHPDVLADLLASGDIERSYPPDAYQRKLANTLASVSQAGDIAALKRALRLFRQREMTRIAWRDLSGRAGIDETMTDVSLTAETCIEQAFNILRQWRGQAHGISAEYSCPPMVVIGMGKLGARELNFSSDVDLIFAYAEDADRDAPPANQNGLVAKICRDLIQVIGEMTVDGFVFRVDMGLRPDGKNGPLAMSFDNMEQYYQIHGREWERYAWIKARIIAGNRAAGKELFNILNPFVYRRYLDFGVFEALREMKQLLLRETQRKGMKHDIKLGPGGIREIEFFGQVFQLIRGGVLPELQEPAIQPVLRLLAQENTIPPATANAMISAYRFLRLTENRLQMFADMQTHRLPTEPDAQCRLAISMGFENWSAFWEAYTGHTNQVHRLFSELLEPERRQAKPQSPEDPLACLWENPPDPESCAEILATAGFRSPETVLGALAELKDETALRSVSAEARRRLDKLIPLTLKATLACKHPEAAFTRILNLLVTLRRRSNYLSLLLENPNALAHLAHLADTSSLIMKYLLKHPLLLDELLDARVLYYPPERTELEALLQKRLSRCPADDLEQRMEALRVFKQTSLLRVAAADAVNTIPLMRVSDYLTDIAETILREVIEISYAHLVEKHGRPQCGLDGHKLERGFAVIAYGKLGGIELGYNSDLDLVFLHAGEDGDTENPRRAISNTQFFARLGQYMLHVLSAHTAAGKLYEADMRLRPSGSSGLLVSHINAFEHYQMNQAWTWETQALVRARPIYGETFLTDRFQDIRCRALTKSNAKNTIKNDIRDMRERMQRERKHKPKRGFDLKQDSGGVIDIEFIVQYLVLDNVRQFPELTAWTDNVRLIRTLEKAGVISDVIAYLLRKAYLTYRSMIHRQNLRERSAVVHSREFVEIKRWIQNIWRHYFAVD